MLDNYKSWNVTETRLKSLEEKIKNALEYGILAPSTHNTQPWSIRKGKNYLVINPDFSRSLPKSDKKNRFLFISMGCLIENVLIAAEYLRLKTKVSYQVSSDSVKITFSTSKGRKQKFDDHLISVIPERATCRLKFNSTLIEQSVINEFKNLSTNEVEVSFINKNENSEIVKVLLDASYASISTDYFRRELSELIIPNKSKSYYGMPGTVLGFKNVQAILTPYLMRMVNIAPLMAIKDKAALNSTDYFGVISTNIDNKKSWIMAGQIFEKLWLQATKEGIALQPLASAIVNDHKKNIKNIFGVKYPQMIFRIGYVDDKKVTHSPRFPLNAITN